MKENRYEVNDSEKIELLLNHLYQKIVPSVNHGIPHYCEPSKLDSVERVGSTTYFSRSVGKELK